MKPAALLLLLLTACAPARLAPRSRADSALAAALPGYTAGKVKVRGNLTITTQAGTGNVATPTVTGKTKAQAAAIGPAATARATKTGGGLTPYLLGAAALALVLLAWRLARWYYLKP